MPVDVLASVAAHQGCPICWYKLLRLSKRRMSFSSAAASRRWPLPRPRQPPLPGRGALFNPILQTAGDQHPRQTVYPGAGPGQEERLAAEEAASKEEQEGEKAPAGRSASATSLAASGIDNTAAGTA